MWNEAKFRLYSSICFGCSLFRDHQNEFSFTTPLGPERLIPLLQLQSCPLWFKLNLFKHLFLVFLFLSPLADKFFLSPLADKFPALTFPPAFPFSPYAELYQIGLTNFSRTLLHTSSASPYFVSNLIMSSYHQWRLQHYPIWTSELSYRYHMK